MTIKKTVKIRHLIIKTFQKYLIVFLCVLCAFAGYFSVSREGAKVQRRK
jgi:hypothetical protein